MTVIASLGMYLFENSSWTRILLVSSVLLPLLSGIALVVGHGKLNVKLSFPGRIQREENVAGELVMENTSVMPKLSVSCKIEITNLMTGERGGTEISGCVGGKRSERLGFFVCPKHSGKLCVRVKELKVLDALGIFARKITCEEETSAIVAANCFPIEISMADTVDFLQDSELYSSQRPGYDPSETFRIREYIPGDPIRQIHWKLSEKTGEVLVRDFGLPVVNDMLLLAETTRIQGSRFLPEESDHVLDLLFSVSYSLLMRELPHTVGWQDRDTMAYVSYDMLNTEDIAALEDLLMSAGIADGEMTVAGCYRAEHAECEYAHAAIISPYLEPDVHLLSRGNRVTVLLVGSPDSFDDISGKVNICYVEVRELAEGGLKVEL